MARFLAHHTQLGHAQCNEMALLSTLVAELGLSQVVDTAPMGAEDEVGGEVLYPT